jgi:hypothetical protein
MTSKRFHLLVALVLLVCLICPFVEMALNSNDNIFQTGQDNETTIALLLLFLELGFALAILFVLFLSSTMEKGRAVTLHRLLKFVPSIAVPLPELSPPLPLRV